MTWPRLWSSFKVNLSILHDPGNGECRPFCIWIYSGNIYGTMLMNVFSFHFWDKKCVIWLISFSHKNSQCNQFVPLFPEQGGETAFQKSVRWQQGWHLQSQVYWPWCFVSMPHLLSDLIWNYILSLALHMAIRNSYTGKRFLLHSNVYLYFLF